METDGAASQKASLVQAKETRSCVEAQRKPRFGRGRASDSMFARGVAHRSDVSGAAPSSSRAPRSSQPSAGWAIVARAALERQLGLEVGVVAVGERDRALALEHRDEALDELGVELAPGDAAQLGHRVLGVIGER